MTAAIVLVIAVLVIAVLVIAAVARYRSLPSRYDPWRKR